jgi:hypothetical protein
MTTPNSTDQLSPAGQRIRELHEVHGLSYRKIAALPEYATLSPATLRREAMGQESKDNHTREILGYPVLDLAPVCPKHGVVHLRKTCPSEGKPRSPRVKHICGNCADWISENIVHCDMGDCKNGNVYETIVDQELYLITMSDFGCRFWQRPHPNPTTRVQCLLQTRE